MTTRAAHKQTVIKLKNVTKHYSHNARGIENVDLEVKEGEVVGFLGPNGAGKTTTINLLLDIIRPNEGEISILGQPVRNNPKLRRDIGYLAGDMEFYDHLTGEQYIQLVGRISGNVSKQRVNILAKRLRADLKKKIKDLSRGNRQKIGLVAALARDTKLLIFDEPTSGLDPLIQQEFNKLMDEYREAGGTAFVSSHILSEVQVLCDRVAFIKEGKVIAVEPLNKLMGKVKKRVTIRAAHSVLNQVSRLSGVENFAISDGSAHFEMSGKPNEVLISLPLPKIEDITIAPPELDELFMRYYESEEEQKS